MNEDWLGNWQKVARRLGAGKAQHTYMRWYEQLLAPIAGKVESVLEIGLGGGESLKLWLELFPNAHVYGIDNTQHFTWTHPRVTTYWLDQKDPALATLFPPESLDVVVDDGLHLFHHQAASVNSLFPALRPQGWYFIEDIIDPRDLHYWARYNRFRVYCDYLREADRDGISVDDMLVVLRKETAPQPWEW